MERYRDWKPTEVDTAGLNLPNKQHWFVGPVISMRDDDHLSASNWNYVTNELEVDSTIGCELHRFNHWGYGYFDIILIHPWRKDLIEKAEEIERALESYPVLDEDDFSRREYEDIESQWHDYGYTELCEIIAKHLAPFDESELTITECDNYALRELCDSNGDLITVNDSHFYQLNNYKLPRIEPLKLWGCVKAIDIDRESFDALSTEVLKLIHVNNIKVTDAYSTNTFHVPDWIQLHYNNPAQPSLPL